jgi:hypothetical protein
MWSAEARMFRSMPGSKAQYHYLTLFVISEFNEWRVLLQGPDTVIQGTRQFTEENARRHAVDVARSYIHDQRHEDLPDPPETAWAPCAGDNWLVWR